MALAAAEAKQPVRSTSLRSMRARAVSGAKRHIKSPVKKTKVICLSDFDGTIFMQEAGHILFDRYGCGARRRKFLDQRIKSGKLSFKAASEEMWGSVRISFDAALQTLRKSLKVDPGFMSFYDFCSEHDVPFSVISDGIQPVLKQILNDTLGEEKAASTNVISNYARINEDGSEWKPHWRHDCELGHDKSVSINEARVQASSEIVQPLVIFIGDGVSDLPAAREADILFARRGLELEKFCVEYDIPYIPFDSFSNIQEVLDFVLRDLQDSDNTSGGSEMARPWRRVCRKNKVSNKISFGTARTPCQPGLRTTKETAASAA